MNPNEELPPEIAHRAYYRQPVWKRIVVIAAGPAVNLADRVRDHLGAAAVAGQRPQRARRQRRRAAGSRPRGYLQPGDRIVSIDGAPGVRAGLSAQQITRAPDAPARGRASTRAPARAATAAARRRPRDGRRPARRQAAHAPHPRRATTHAATGDAARLRVTARRVDDRSARSTPPASRVSHDVGRHDGDGRRASPRSSTARRSASRSPASSASYEVTRQSIAFDTTPRARASSR